MLNYIKSLVFKLLKCRDSKVLYDIERAQYVSIVDGEYDLSVDCRSTRINISSTIGFQDHS